MIKFTPFLIPNIEGTTNVACQLVFDSLPHVKQLEDNPAEYIVMDAVYQEEKIRCIFIAPNGANPAVCAISLDPVMCVINGIMIIPNDSVQKIVSNFKDVSFIPLDEHDAKEAQSSEEEKEQKEESTTSIRDELIPFLDAYSRIETEQNTKEAFQCVKILNEIPFITQQEYDFIQSLPCGSAKLSSFVLGKLKEKIK